MISIYFFEKKTFTDTIRECIYFRIKLLRLPRHTKEILFKET